MTVAQIVAVHTGRRYTACRSSNFHSRAQGDWDGDVNIALFPSFWFEEVND